MKYLKLLIALLLSFSLQAQQYYYNGSEKVYVYESDEAFITYDQPSSQIKQAFSEVELAESKGFTTLTGKKKTSTTLKSLRSNGLGQITPALLTKKGGELKMFPTKIIRVKLKPDSNERDILSLLDKSDVESIEERYGVLQLRISDIHKIVDLANKIYESGLVEFSMPDFYIPIVLNQQAIQDPLFPLQFQMNNTGQVIDGVAGVNDMDCNALEAWDLALGNGVTVAVFDEGMEAHDDLGNRLVGGFTPATNGNGTPVANDADHGMQSAGVIGATHNDLGVRGVASNVDFLSVNIRASGTTSGDIANGIQWAVDNGAIVLSNSWSYDAPCGYVNADLENAIQDATNDGAIFITSSGNTGGCVTYPSGPNVISVGAFDNRGNLYNYSARGPELDLVAPSGLTGGNGNIRTLDRMDNLGGTTGDYSNSFGGTSASCPVVAGVAALVLSVNPNLTPQQVRNILTNTAIDMGAPGFDNDFGFGRVNACGAVLAAYETMMSVSGSSVVCSSNKTFNLNNLTGLNVNWTTSNNINISSLTDNSVIVQASSSTVSGGGWIRAEIDNGCGEAIIEKDVWVGRPADPSPVQGSTDVVPNAWEYYSVPAQEEASSYTWVIPSGWSFHHTSSTTSNQVLLVTGSSSGYVRARANNACGNSNYRSKYVTVSGNDCGSPVCYFTYSPNPVEETLTVEMEPTTFDLRSNDTYKISLNNKYGKIVYEAESNSICHDIDMKKMPKGMYRIVVSHKDKQQIAKILKQ